VYLKKSIKYLEFLELNSPHLIIIYIFLFHFYIQK